MRPTLAQACCTLAFLTPAFLAPAFGQAPVRPAPHPASPTELPITRVALYKNGVGFFEHSGRVQGDQEVTIDFTSAQLNDVLQSLTAIDLGGGRISGAGYNSTTPLEQQLKTLPLALSAAPTDVDFYNAIRGARVQVTAPGASITGRLLSLDLRANPGKASDADSAPSQDQQRRFVTVVADSGTVRTLELTSAVTVTLLDTALHTDVTRYLELLAANRSEGLRHLTLTDRGNGARELRVSYISEVPVWKSTYRILFTDANLTKADATATVQGWSVVDNTTGSDWTNVHLDLIAGAPQSFIQPLSTPYYARRPEIPLPEEAQLAPQTHDSGEMSANETVNVADGGDSTTLTLKNKSLNSLVQTSPGVMARRERSVTLGSGMGVGGGIAGGSGYSAGAAPMQALPKPMSYQNYAQASIAPNTSTAAFDDFFEYTLTDPITIRKNESALVPILQTKLPVERVSLWSVQQPTALRALWITNTSTLTLDRGSFAIVENGSFGGEGLLDPIHPGEKRLLSYAADQAVRVSQDRVGYNRKITSITIKKGVLTEHSIDVSENNYTIHNAAPEARTVLIEQAINRGWTLNSNIKPAETTPTTYRFPVPVKPGATEHLRVAQSHTTAEGIRLVDRTEDQLVLLLHNDKVSPAALAKLQPVFDLHHQVVALDEQIRQKQSEITEITNDQDRLRKNLEALKGTPEEKALATRYTGELNSQEDRIATLRKEIEQLKVQRQAADEEFNTRLEAIDFDETL
jgi:hypothetical protein